MKLYTLDIPRRERCILPRYYGPAIQRQISPL